MEDENENKVDIEAGSGDLVERYIKLGALDE